MAVTLTCNGATHSPFYFHFCWQLWAHPWTVIICCSASLCSVSLAEARSGVLTQTLNFSLNCCFSITFSQPLPPSTTLLFPLSFSASLPFASAAWELTWSEGGRLRVAEFKRMKKTPDITRCGYTNTPPSSPYTKPMWDTLDDHRSDGDLWLRIPSVQIFMPQTVTFILLLREELRRSQTALETAIPHRLFYTLITFWRLVVAIPFFTFAFIGLSLNRLPGELYLRLGYVIPHPSREYFGLTGSPLCLLLHSLRGKQNRQKYNNNSERGKKW